MLVFHGVFCETPVKTQMSSGLNKCYSFTGHNERLETGRSLVLNPLFFLLLHCGCAQMFQITNQRIFENLLCTINRNCLEDPENLYHTVFSQSQFYLLNKNYPSVNNLGNGELTQVFRKEVIIEASSNQGRLLRQRRDLHWIS